MNETQIEYNIPTLMYKVFWFDPETDKLLTAYFPTEGSAQTFANAILGSDPHIGKWTFHVAVEK